MRGRILRAEPWLLPIAFVALKWSALSAPIFWDEVLVYAGPALSLSRESLLHVLPGLHRADFFFGHTPGLALLIAAVLKLFGEHRELARAVMLALSACTLHFTYRLAALYGGRAAGWLAAAALAGLPTFYAHSTQVLGDVAATAAVAGAFFFFAGGKLRAYAALAAVAFLFKETALFLGAAVLVTALARRRPARELALLAAPVAVAAAYYLLEKLLYGKFFNFPLMQNVSSEPGGWLSRFGSYAALFFWFRQSLWVVTLAAIAGAAFALATGRGAGRVATGATLVGVAFFLAGVAFLDPINSRYSLPVLPLLFALAASGAARIFPRPWLLALPAAAYAWIVGAHHFDRPQFPGTDGEDNMQYADVIRAHELAIDYALTHRGNGRVVSVWPLAAEVRDPFFGYEKLPDEWVDWGWRKDLTNVSVGVFAQSSDVRELPSLAEELRKRGLSPEHSFEVGGNKVEVWTYKDALRSARFPALGPAQPPDFPGAEFYRSVPVRRAALHSAPNGAQSFDFPTKPCQNR